MKKTLFLYRVVLNFKVKRVSIVLSSFHLLIVFRTIPCTSESDQELLPLIIQVKKKFCELKGEILYHKIIEKSCSVPCGTVKSS